MHASLLSIMMPLVLGAVLSAVLVDLVRRLAVRAGALDVPNRRSAHDVPVPRLGGVGIILAVAVAVVTVGSPWSAVQAAALLLVALVSLADDLWRLPATPRLLSHICAAVAVLATDPAGWSWWSFLLAIWIVGFINAFNFMDGIDGIAGLHAMVAGTTWMIVGGASDEPAVALAGALIAGAAAGFLVHNWSPARVFMGDAGATALGVALASMPWLTRDPSAWVLVAMVAVWPFWLDAGVTLVARIRRRVPLHDGHQEHVYQRLVARGWSHRSVALAYGVATLAGGVVATGLVTGVVSVNVVSAIGVAAMAAGFALHASLSRGANRSPRRAESVS